MTKRFNLKYLQDICFDKKIKLVEKYYDKNLMSQTLINFECINCGEHTSKQFINIEKYNAFCKICSNFTCKNKIKFDIIFLNKLCKEKSMVLTKDYSLENLNSLTQIEFKCIDCNKNISKRFQYIQKYDAVCNDCSVGKKGIKSRNTTLIKYGVKNISELQEIKNKKKETTLNNYGVEHNSQCKEIKNKKIQTSLKNNGVEHPQQSILIKNKSKETCLKKYGYEYPSQNKKIMEKISKNCYKSKKLIFPSGKEIICQGYEPFALEELLKNNICEDDIITGCKNVPTIWYNDDLGKKHRHYVDIFIPSQNKCIEIKSKWTVNIKKTMFLKNKLLQKNWDIFMKFGFTIIKVIKLKHTHNPYFLKVNKHFPDKYLSFGFSISSSSSSVSELLEILILFVFKLHILFILFFGKDISLHFVEPDLYSRLFVPTIL